MPDDRLFHRRACHGDRSTSLTDLEYRVWTTYLLCADDYGVMRFSVAALKAASDALEDRPVGALDRAFARVADVGLIRVFEHQGKRYAYQPDWQDWQSVRHPRQTVNPMPPSDHVSRCSQAQRELFAKHDGNLPDQFPKDSRNTSEEFPPLASAGTREAANGLRLPANGYRLMAEAFDAFWNAYPKKKSKEQARKAFEKLKPGADLQATILAAIEAQRRSTAWLKDGGQFIPYPASWLNAGGWQDEPDVDVPQIGAATANSLKAIYGQ